MTVQVECKLIILSSLTNKTFILLDDDKVPSIDYTNSFNDSLSELLAQYTNINIDWVEIKLSTYIDGIGKIVFVYACIIPYDTNLIKGEWKDIYHVSEDIQRLIHEVTIKRTGRFIG